MITQGREANANRRDHKAFKFLDDGGLFYYEEN